MHIEAQWFLYWSGSVPEDFKATSSERWKTHQASPRQTADAAWCAIQVLPVSQEELALEGVTQIAGAPNAEYLKHLPQTLEHLTFKDEFNQDLKPVKLPRNLQTLTFGSDLDRSLEQVTLPSSLQTLTFGTQFTRCLDRVTLPSSLQALTFGSGFNRLLWKAHVPNWREPSTHPSEIRARTNVDQIFGIMHQDGLPKRAMRTARRLFFVYYADPGGHRCRTRADRIFCKNWTAHRRNKFLKEFGDYLPLPILLLARRLRTQKCWHRFCMDRDYRRSPKKLLKSYPREYRGKLKALVADIRTLDPEVWHRDWNLKRKHELAFEYGRFLTRKQVQRLLACPEHPRSST